MLLNLDILDFIRGMASVKLGSSDTSYLFEETKALTVGPNLRLAILKHRQLIRIWGQLVGFSFSLSAIWGAVYFGLGGQDMAAIACALAVWAPQWSATLLLNWIASRASA